MPTEQMTSANLPLSSSGRTYHVETRPGEMSNRILTVGDPTRAQLLSSLLTKEFFRHTSPRGFLTITGLYRNVPVTIVAIGMGLSMMDFFVRETRLVVQGPLAIVRLGSCGSLGAAGTGDLVVAESAFGIGRNFDYFTEMPTTTTTITATTSDEEEKKREPYLFWAAVQADERLTGLVKQELQEVAEVFPGSVGNADGFYASQGRPADAFWDANDGLLDEVRRRHPDVMALEMESHMLFHLAKVSTGKDNQQAPSVSAACALVVFADRQGNRFISPEDSQQKMLLAARALLDALVEYMPTQDGLHPSAGSVWEGENLG
ncbi:hypothetical protein LPJ53_002130 [Coemansia erecta]|uniref:Nucleoside phosphorylase domain-containing protein n=1 Tax=Coemansia erecta TaxID=147472 RepID=A0A9W7Y3X2_9FUNG|nr:hypothetical protein LPJ53_002130 [Coemansia erecta]